MSLLHARLGHPSIGKIKYLTVPYDGNEHDFSCEPCVFEKHHKLPYSLSHSLANHPFDLIHVDLWGPYKTPSLSGAQYFLTILDDNTRTTWTHLIHTKQQVPPLLSAFLSYVKNHFDVDIEHIRSDNGTEIVQEYSATLFANKGIIHQRSIHGKSQQNGRVGRTHRHLLETGRALRFQGHLPLKFWGDCILSATFLINMLPSSVLNWKTPIELLLGKRPDYNSLRVIGSLCYPFFNTGDKFSPSAKRCVLLCYPNSKGKMYRNNPNYWALSTTNPNYDLLMNNPNYCMYLPSLLRLPIEACLAGKNIIFRISFSYFFLFSFFFI